MVVCTTRGRKAVVRIQAVRTLRFLGLAFRFAQLRERENAGQRVFDETERLEGREGREGRKRREGLVSPFRKERK